MRTSQLQSLRDGLMSKLGDRKISFLKNLIYLNISSRLTPVEAPVQSLSREELNLLEVVEDVALQAIRRVQCDVK